MDETDDRLMARALAQAVEQLKRYGIDDGGERPNPLVGCVVVTQAGEFKEGYRGELYHSDHAEFTVMEKKFGRDELLSGATVYTTLEPCIDRRPPKVACASRLIERNVRRVVIGMMDPDGRGHGARELLRAGIIVEAYRPDHDLNRRITELNRVFIKSRTVPTAPVAGNEVRKPAPAAWEFPETAMYASPDLLEDLIRLSNHSSLAMGECLAFQVFDPSRRPRTVALKRPVDDSAPVELTSPSRDKLRELVVAAGFREPFKGHLLNRAEAGAPGRFRNRIGCRQLVLERHDVGQAIQVEACRLSYWFDQEFNRKMLVDSTDRQLKVLRRIALDSILKPYDNHVEMAFPSTLFVEVALLTSDEKLLLLRKSQSRSALAKTGRTWTCTIEEGLLWDPQCDEIDFKGRVLEGIEDELQIDRTHVKDVELHAVGIEYTHLNTALLGVAILSLTSFELRALLEPKIQANALHDFQDLELLPLQGALEVCGARGPIWHPTALFRIYLALQSRR